MLTSSGNDLRREFAERSEKNAVDSCLILAPFETESENYAGGFR